MISRDRLQVVVVISELEQKLVNALQINPRASWTTIGEILGVDPVTVARHWTALESAGHAWINVDAGGHAPAGPWVVAFALVTCAAGELQGVVERLCAEGPVFGIDHVSGRSDLLLSITVPDLTALSDYLMVGLGAAVGVEHVDLHVATRIVKQGRDWRLRALSPDEQRRVRATRPDPATGVRPPDPDDDALLRAVIDDPRISYSGLARATGASVSTVRRRLNRLLAAGHLTMRCEIAQAVSGWPVSSLLRCRIPPSRWEAAALQVAALPEARFCAMATGSGANLLLGAWLRSVADLERLVLALEEQVDGLHVVDRSLILRHVKRVGYVLDRWGRPVRRIPLQEPAGKASIG